MAGGWRSDGARAGWKAVLLLLCGLAVAEGRPVRGSRPFTVILCAFRNAGNPPAGYDFSYYQNSFLFSGLSAYYNEVSLGNLDFQGSKLGGWYLSKLTLAQAQQSSRQANWDSCVSAAAAKGFSAPSNQLVFIVTWPAIDLFSFPGEGAIVPYNAPVNALAHEMGHSLLLEHSFSNDGYQNPAPWANPGEYGDPWDLMSYGNVYGTNSPYHETGPGLAAYHMDRLGWLPQPDIMTFGKDGAAAGTYQLRPLTGKAEGPKGAYRLIRVYGNPKDPFEHVTLELRAKKGVNAGIPEGGQVLMHLVQRRTLYTPPRTFYAPTLLYNLKKQPKKPTQEYQYGNIMIRVLESSDVSATVSIVSGGLICKAGFVFRSITRRDTVCVTPDERSRARQETARAPHAQQDGSCADGLVPRLALQGDTACVSEGRRVQVAADNAARTTRTYVSSIWGPNQCKAGMVWRLADSFDWVCVKPEVQAQVANQTLLARRAGRVGNCRAPQVQRQAFPGDKVCVDPQVAAQNAEYNADASSNLLLPIA